MSTASAMAVVILTGGASRRMGQDKSTADSPLDEGMLGVKEAVEFSRLSRAELYAAMARGDLKFYQYGRRRLIAKKDLVSWLAASLTASQV